MNGFHLSIIKTEHMECRLRKRRIVYNLELKVRDYIIPYFMQFIYLESIAQNNGEIERDVNHRV